MKKQQKNIVMITPLFSPHLGGVEKHVLELSKELIKNGYGVEIITHRHQTDLVCKEDLVGIKIHRFFYPKFRFFGLITIWWQMISKYLNLFKKAQVIHVHDVMIWFLPLRILFPKKRVVLTMHGWEGVFPIPKKNILLKKISAIFANKVVCVGEYISKHYQVRCDEVIYGGVSDSFFSSSWQKQNTLVYLGRLESDAGLPILLELIKKDKKSGVIFAGDGFLRSQCEAVGKVTGWLPEKKIASLLSNTRWCVASGYLSALEALASGCEVIVIADNQLRQDYWQLGEIRKLLHVVKNSQEMSEVIEKIGNSKIVPKNTVKNFNKKYSWEKLAQQYLQIYFS